MTPTASDKNRLCTLVSVAAFMLVFLGVGSMSARAELQRARFSLGADALTQALDPAPARKQRLEKARRAYQRVRTPRTLAELGLAEIELEMWVEAYEHLSAVLGQQDPWVLHNLKSLESAVDPVRFRVAWLVITGPEGAILTVNGTPRGMLPLPGRLTVLAGDTTIALSAGGYETMTQKHFLEPEKLKVLVLEPKQTKPSSEQAHSAGPVRSPQSLAAELSLGPTTGQGFLEGLPENASPDPATPRPRLTENFTVAPSSAVRPSWWSRNSSWLLVSVSVPALVAGGYLIATDGKPACTLPPEAPPGAQCNYQRATMVQGLALVAFGVAADVTAAFLSVRNRSAISVGLAPRGLVASRRF